MTVNTPPLDRLRAEYLDAGEHLALMRRAGGDVNSPEGLRLQAREMEIVDQVAAAGMTPDVLVKA